MQAQQPGQSKGEALSVERAPSTGAHQFSLKRFKVLLRSQRHLLVFFTLVVGAANAVQALTEVPLYISTSKLQLQNFDIGRSVDAKAAVAADVMSESTRLNNAVLVFQSETFLNELAKELNANHDKEKLVLSWGIGRKLKLSYALFRLGITDVQYQRVDTAKLSLEELGLLLSGMIQITALATDETIEVKISALEEKTAYSINRAVLTAFARANERLDQDEFDRSIKFLKDQAEVVHDKLDAAEQKLADYMKGHLNVATDGVSTAFMSEFLGLRMKRQEVQKSIEADRQLIAQLNGKLKSLDGNEGSAAEVLEALKTEVVQLNYQKAKLLEQAYAPDHPGVLAIERRIDNSRDFIRKSQSKVAIEAKDVYGPGEYRRSLAGKIIQTQDGLAKQELALKGILERLRGMEGEVNNLPLNGIAVSSLKREVGQNAELHGELVRRLEMMRVRSQASKSTLREVTAPNALNAPNTIPFLPKFAFGLLAGFFVGISAILLMDAIRPRVVIRGDVESAGFRYAGRFSSSRDSCAEVLAALECIFKQKSKWDEPTPIVLCGSATPALTLHTFLPLIDYMASRNQNVLLVAEDPTWIPGNYESCSLIDGVKIYRFDQGRKDIVHIHGAENFGVIRMVLEEYAEHYSSVFLFVAKGSESSVYSLCRGIANRILMFGEEGSHSVEDFRTLSAGFHDPAQVFTALLPYSGLHLRYLKSQLAFKTRRYGFRKSPLNHTSPAEGQRPGLG